MAARYDKCPDGADKYKDQQGKIAQCLRNRLKEYQDILNDAATPADYERLSHLYDLIVALRRYCDEDIKVSPAKRYA